MAVETNSTLVYDVTRQLYFSVLNKNKSELDTYLENLIENTTENVSAFLVGSEINHNSKKQLIASLVARGIQIGNILFLSKVKVQRPGDEGEDETRYRIETMKCQAVAHGKKINSPLSANELLPFQNYCKKIVSCKEPDERQELIILYRNRLKKDICFHKFTQMNIAERSEKVSFCVKWSTLLTSLALDCNITLWGPRFTRENGDLIPYLHAECRETLRIGICQQRLLGMPFIMRVSLSTKRHDFVLRAPSTKLIVTARPSRWRYENDDGGFAEKLDISSISIGLDKLLMMPGGEGMLDVHIRLWQLSKC